MRPFISIVIIAVIATTCSPKELPTIMKVDDNGFALFFSHMTTQKDMQYAKEKLFNTHGLTLDDSQSTYFDGGSLRILALDLNQGEKVVGRLNADLQKIQYSYYGYKGSMAEFKLVYIKAGSMDVSELMH